MRHLRLSIPLLMAATLAAPLSHADDRTTAQQLFQQGKALMAEGKVAQACPKFEGASQLSPTAGVRLNLAECWAKLGRTASAWSKYDEALALAERAGDKDAAELARRGRAEIEPKLSYLSVTVSKQALVPGLELSRDGQKFPEAAWGTPVPVDPGEHEVNAKAPGRKPWSVKKTVAGDGAKVSLEVPVLAEEDKAAVGAPDPTSAPQQVPTDTGPAATQRTLAWVAGGLGVVGIGVGSYFGLRAKSKKNDYQSHQAPNGACLDMDCQTLSQDAHSAGNVSTVAFLAGGALVATGVVLWFTAPSGTGNEGRAKLVPLVGTQVAGLDLSGSW
jgi:hypothetical protein